MDSFLDIDAQDWVAENSHAFAIRDRFPVTPGHTLVISKRHIVSWFEASEDERSSLMALVDEVKEDIDRLLEPDGYNVGFNVGDAAGQTVPHLHIHVIPRTHDDMADPRGGVRYVIPRKGNYARVQPTMTGVRDPYQAIPGLNGIRFVDYWAWKHSFGDDYVTFVHFVLGSLLGVPSDGHRAGVWAIIKLLDTYPVVDRATFDKHIGEIAGQRVVFEAK